MAETDKERPGPITTLLVEDHRRLDGLLCSSRATADQINQTTYDQFRAGLLRHIGMEEKLLLPAVQRWHQRLLEREGFRHFGANPALGA